MTPRPLLAVSALVAALSACRGTSDPVAVDPGRADTTSTATTNVTGSSPRPLVALGQGVVTARYTGEVTVRPLAGDYAYTST